MSGSPLVPRYRAFVPLVCLVGLLLALAAAESARAAGWLPPVNVASGPDPVIAEPRIAMDDRGDVFAIWVAPGPPRRVMVSKRPLGGAWESPQSLDAANMVDPLTNPDIAVDGAGNAVAVWTSGTGMTSIIRQARRAVGDTAFGTELGVPSGGDTNEFPDVAVNRAGTAVVGLRSRSGNPRATFSRGDTTNTPFASSTSYAEPADPVSSPTVTINEQGDIAAAWEYTPPSASGIHATYIPDGGSFPLTAEDVDSSGSTTLSKPRVALDSQGRAVAVYVASTGPRVRSKFRAAGTSQTWQALPDLEQDIQPTNWPTIAFDSQDVAVAAWEGGDSGEPVRTAERPAGDQTNTFPPPPPQMLSDGSEIAGSLVMDSSAQGTVALGWRGNGDSSVRAAIRPPGGPFGPGAKLNATGRMASSPAIAADFTGNAAAVWVDTDGGGDDQITSAIYDATAATFTDVQVPAAADVGTPVSMLVGATDDWSDPAIAWDFGDGATGTGASVSHTYSAAGTYNVTAGATDAAGNIATVTRDVVVSAVVVPPTPPPTPPPTKPPVDVPTRGVDFNASSVSGQVLVSLPKNAPVGRVLARPVVRGAAAIKPPRGYLPFRDLGKDDNIPVGSILDASKGTSSLTMATNAPGTVTQTGQFSKGVYITKQSLKKALTTTVMLGGGNFKRDCGAAKSGVGAARGRPHRQLFANVKGRFRTRGRHSTATVRGTQYLVKDSCRGTLTAVQRGSVRVFDLVKHRSRVLKAGKSYLARPKSALKRRRR